MILVVLAALLGGLLFLAFSPGALNDLAGLLVPGVVQIPAFGPVTPPAEIFAPPGELPVSQVAFAGLAGRIGVDLGCGFLFELEDGRRGAVFSAHAAPPLPPSWSAALIDIKGAAVANLPGALGRGRTFRRDGFDMDYSLWSVETGAAGPFLKPDTRGQAQAGERVVLFTNRASAAGGVQSWLGSVILVSPRATWIQLDSAAPVEGLSGCPVVSQYTGRLVGMAVAGVSGAKTTLGLHPAGSLADKLDRALER